MKISQVRWDLGSSCKRQRVTLGSAGEGIRSRGIDGCGLGSGVQSSNSDGKTKGKDLPIV